MRRAFAPILLSVVLALAGCGGSSTSSSNSPAAGTSTTSSTTATTQTSTSKSATELGFEGMPIEQGPDLAPASTTGTGMVDGIKCGPTEQLLYHIHAHLAVYDNGRLLALPGGIGIPGSRVLLYPGYGPVANGGRCIYWLHTHAPDGVVHIESPVSRVYTLGNFFAEWRQPLSRAVVAGVSGKVTAVVDGKPWTGDPRDIPLIPHADIQLDIGSPLAPFQPVPWARTQL